MLGVLDSIPVLNRRVDEYIFKQTCSAICGERRFMIWEDFFQFYLTAAKTILKDGLQKCFSIH